MVKSRQADVGAASRAFQGAHLTFSHTQYLGDLERGHSCPPLRPGQRQSGQECPRSEKSEMRTISGPQNLDTPFV